MPFSIDFHPSQFPHQVKARLLDAIEHAELPARFLYDSPGQAARWLAYHDAWSPSRREDGLRRLYGQAFEHALNTIGDIVEVSYVSLGCGGGTKDADFVARCAEREVRVRPVLTDTSPSLVLASMLRVPSTQPRGLVIDLEATPERSAFVSLETTTIWSAFGMVPNLEHRGFLRWLRDTMGPADIALVSANLHPEPWPGAGPVILPQYDNPEARRWYEGALLELGVRPLDLSIGGRPLDAQGSAWRVEVKARLPEETTIRVFDHEFELDDYADLSVFFSNRFTSSAFADELIETGLEIVATFLFESGEEGIWLLGPSTETERQQSGTLVL